MSRGKTPFPWPGSKARISDWVINHFPRHDTFVDAFGGAGGILFADRPTVETVYNDANPDLVNFFEVLRDHPSQLLEEVESIPYARPVHEEYATEFFNGYRDSDKVRRAARYYFLRRTQFGGEAAKKAGFRSSVDGRRNPARQWNNSLSRLASFSDALTGVELRNDDYRCLFDDFRTSNSRTLLYCDPPYLETTERYETTPHLPEFDFERFVEEAIQFEGADLLISTDAIPDRWGENPDMDIVSRNHYHSMNAAGGAKDVTEYLVGTYNLSTAAETSTANQSLLDYA